MAANILLVNIMEMNDSKRVLELVRKNGILKTKDLKAHGINSKILTRLVNEGRLVRIDRGLYRLTGIEYETRFHNYAEIHKRFPKSVICLLSALSFHEITTQLPYQIWIAIEEKARRPKSEGVALRVVRFSKKALEEGVEEYPIEGVPVRITNPARTVADCFKYRNKIGLDVALEALREGLRDRRFTRDEFWQYAKLCRVSNVIRPYMEAMI